MFALESSCRKCYHLMMHKNLIKHIYSFKIKALIIRNREQTLNFEITDCKISFNIPNIIPTEVRNKGRIFLEKKNRWPYW